MNERREKWRKQRNGMIIMNEERKERRKEGGQEEWWKTLKLKLLSPLTRLPQQYMQKKNGAMHFTTTYIYIASSQSPQQPHCKHAGTMSIGHTTQKRPPVTTPWGNFSVWKMNPIPTHTTSSPSLNFSLHKYFCIMVNFPHFHIPFFFLGHIFQPRGSL